MRPAPAIFFSALCCLAGCNSPPPAAPAPADFGGWSWYALNTSDPGANDIDVSAAWGSRDKKLVYVVLADAAATSATTVNTAGGRTEYTVDLTLPDGRKAELRIETADGKTGSAVYGGRVYDLAQGSVFVLLPGGEKPELRQFRRDISGVTAGIPGVQKLIRDDPELVGMFARAK